jgi:hypothetical protein
LSDTFLGTNEEHRCVHVFVDEESIGESERMHLGKIQPLRRVVALPIQPLGLGSPSEHCLITVHPSGLRLLERSLHKDAVVEVLPELRPQQKTGVEHDDASLDGLRRLDLDGCVRLEVEHARDITPIAPWAEWDQDAFYEEIIVIGVTVVALRRITPTLEVISIYLEVPAESSESSITVKVL